MSFTKDYMKVTSSDGVHQLAGVLYLPEGEIRGFFHVVHGMTEYIGRYDRFMSDMANEGWLCFGYDHLGHGHTVNDDSELGFIASKNGWDLLCRDVKVFSDAVIEKYSEGRQLPYVLMGHSMGSFVARLAAEKYVRPKKLIVMGTGGPNPAAGAGLVLVSLVKLFKGEKHISKLLYDLCFGNYDSRFPDVADAPNAWLTTDLEIRKKYADDKLCTFKFTASAMGDLIRVMKYSNRKDWYKNLDRSIQVMLVSGENDPVGNFGKGVEQVFEGLIKQDHSCAMKLYEGARHEILNDFTYEEVKKDICEFI